MRISKLIAFTLGILIFNACKATPDASSNTNSKIDQENIKLSGLYKIESLNGNAILDELTIDFDEQTNKVSGFSGCNSFFGNFNTENNLLSIGPLASTKKSCLDQNSERESEILKALSTVDEFEVKDNNLQLKNSDEVVIVFTKKTAEVKKQEYIKITYTANTRGFYEKLWVENAQMYFTNDRVAKKVVSNPIPKNVNQTLSNMIREIKIENLPNLKLPSKAFQNDGAAIAILEVETQSGVYQTKSFDHGNPPKLIKDLVEKLLSIKESMSE